MLLCHFHCMPCLSQKQTLILTCLCCHVQKRQYAAGNQMPFWTGMFHTSTTRSSIVLLPPEQLLPKVVFSIAEKTAAQQIEGISEDDTIEGFVYRARGICRRKHGSGDPVSYKQLGRVQPSNGFYEFACFPASINGSTPCMTRTGDRMVNECGKQIIVHCTVARHVDDCVGILDSNTETAVRIENSTSTTIQFEALYTVNSIGVYHVPDAGNLKTRPKNCFTAIVQCLLHGNTTWWKNVGFIRGCKVSGPPQQRTPDSGWMSTPLEKCVATTWRLANITLQNFASKEPKSTENNDRGKETELSLKLAREIVISELNFERVFVSSVLTVLPIDDNPCAYAMSITPDSKPRPVVTTRFPANSAKCFGPSTFRQLGEPGVDPISHVCWVSPSRHPAPVAIDP